MGSGVAIAAALGSALCFASSSVLQQRGASGVPPNSGYRLIQRLLCRPMWLAGLGAALGTVVLQAVALAKGELMLVQPLTVLGLLFALPVSVLLEKCKPSRREWAWALVLIVGLTVFLGAARPGAGPPIPDDATMWWLGAVALTVAGLAVAAGAGPGRRHRAALFGFATGITFGLSAALLKYSYALAEDHWGRLFTSWPGYVLIVVGGTGILLNQLAYRSGPLAGALPPIAITDPLVAVLFGVTAFSETLRTGPVAIAFQILGFLTVATAIVQLARYSAGRDAREPVTAGDELRREPATAAVG